MANKYVNIEEIGKILSGGKLNELGKKVSTAERSVQDILKKLSDLDSAQTAKKLEEEQRLAQEKQAEEQALKAKQEAELAEKKKQEEEQKAEEAKAQQPAPEQPAAPAEQKDEKTFAPAEQPAPKAEEKPAKPASKPAEQPRTAPKAKQSEKPAQGKPPVGKTFVNSDGSRQKSDRPSRPQQGGANRAPQQSRPQQGARPAAPAPVASSSKPAAKNFGPDKKKGGYEKTYVEKERRAPSKRSLAKQQGPTVADFDEDKSGYRKLRVKKDKKQQSAQTIKIEHAVVTVMGHVDHGKTSLLDYIRRQNVAAGEAGGITQHIGAYSVSVNGKSITFIDTPGHEAFTAMRARGAQVTDIVILVVAADDGIMPQTVEAINHAKAANVSIIVAINKIDKAGANPEKVKQELMKYDLVPEEWGGDTPVCLISCKTGQGIDELLENVLLVAEMKELLANPAREARGTVIEAQLDKGKGPVATVLIQNGTLHTGDNIISGTITGRVRAMIDDKGRTVKEAGPSAAVYVLGFEQVPNAGDSMFAVSQELMKSVIEERKRKESDAMVKAASKISLDEVFGKIAEGNMKTLNLIVKGDVQGSVEAVKQSVVKLSNEEVQVKVIHSGAGAITESDVMLADSSNAIILGFNVRPDAKAKATAERSKVDIRLYRIIYDLLDDVEAALKGMLAPKYQEVYLGKCEVRQTFKITGVGTVAGCYVKEGKIVRGGKLRIYRDNVLIVEGNVQQLKRFKDDVKEVNYGYECGCAIEGFNDIHVGDIIECYMIEQVQPK